MAKRSVDRPRSPTVSSDKTPLETAVDQAMDAFVYAPIGLLFDGPALFPKLVQHGRNQVQVARMMGQMAVQMGQSELTKRAAATPAPVRDVLAGLGIVDAPKPGPAPASEPEPEPAAKAPARKTAAKKTAPKKTSATRSSAKKAATRARTTAKSARKVATDAASALGISDYDSLSASQVVQRLRGLVPEELEAVRAYESATRARKTVLNKIAQVQKD